MTPTKQLLSLMRFNAAINPYVFFMLIGFGTPLLIEHSASRLYQPSLASVLQVQNLFMVGLMGVWTLAPEMGQRTWNRGVGTVYSGSEFLLTRAIDRAVLYRSRALYLYLLVLIVPVLSMTWSLFHPDLLFAEYSKALQNQYLQVLPGSSLRPDARGGTSLIFFPHGRLWISAWQTWLFVVATMAVQVLLFAIYRLPFRMFFYYAVFMGAVFLPLFLGLASARHHLLPRLEQFFLWQTVHPFVFWLMTATAWVVVQAWCERRFLQQEQ
jgi:hypothetical protein